jgi:hypothetical protein
MGVVRKLEEGGIAIDAISLKHGIKGKGQCPDGCRSMAMEPEER